MGICSGTSNQRNPPQIKDNKNDPSRPKPAISSGGQQDQNQQQQQQYQQIANEQAKPNLASNANNPLPQNPPGEEDDFYLQDIMKQFDELNNLFQQMSEEFENMSKYLASINDGD